MKLEVNNNKNVRSEQNPQPIRLRRCSQSTKIHCREGFSVERQQL